MIMVSVDQTYRINEVLSRIHSDITADLSAKVLAQQVAYSEHYFHRLFKRATGENIHAYIRRTRLEMAANHLMFSPERPVERIAKTCGFRSLSSFSRAFKSVYGLTPGQWRAVNRHPDGESSGISASPSDTPTPKSVCPSGVVVGKIIDPDIRAAYQRINTLHLPVPEIVLLKPRDVAYVRHMGYGRSISRPWQLLKAWALTEQRSMDIQIGLHHSNPALVPLEECRYVACVGIDKPVVRRGAINSVTIPGGLHAAFKIAGRYGELLPHISKIFDEWLPQSPFTAKTTPAFAAYHKNQFLSQEDDFDLTFYVPLVLEHKHVI